MLPAQDADSQYLLQYITIALTTCVSCTVLFKTLRRPATVVRECGVAARRVGRTLQEIERKTFHVAGLLVPLVHQVLLGMGWTQNQCANLCWTITLAGGLADAARITVPFVRDNWPGKHLLRDREKDTLCGACFFSLGCTVCIAVSPPSIAMTAILFLVLGDMAAAIIGVSFGGERCTLRMGREGKKSMEGSVAMFIVCLFIGFSVFLHSHLREYPVVIGALVATLTELYEPFGLNDNLTIPLFSSIAMQWGFARIQSCELESPLTVLSNMRGTAN